MLLESRVRGNWKEGIFDNFVELSRCFWNSALILRLMMSKDGITCFLPSVFKVFSNKNNELKSQTYQVFLKFLRFIIIAPSKTRNPWCSAWCVSVCYHLLPAHWSLLWWSLPLLLPPIWSWNFSTMGFIHTKLCNRVSTTSVENLVYVKTNMGVICDSFHDSSHMTEEYEGISDDGSCIVIGYRGRKTKDRVKTSQHLSNKTFKTLTKIKF